MSAIKTATPTLVYSAVSDAATTQQEINKIKNKNIRMYHPWSSLTDGGLYDELSHSAIAVFRLVDNLMPCRLHSSCHVQWPNYKLKPVANINRDAGANIITWYWSDVLCMNDHTQTRSTTQISVNQFKIMMTL